MSRPLHTHECRGCGDDIDCNQTDEECDGNGGIGQYNGLCDACNQAEAEMLRAEARAEREGGVRQ